MAKQVPTCPRAYFIPRRRLPLRPGRAPDEDSDEMRLILLLALLGATQMPAAPPATPVPPKPNPKQELGKLLLGGDIYTSLEEMLARELPKRVAPADKWDVKIARDGNDLSAGKLSHVEVHGVKCIVDEMNLMYLVGTEIDYVEGLQGAGFKFQNPNVKSTCGCGSSFSV